MKKTWIVLNSLKLRSAHYAESTSEFNEDITGEREREHTSLYYAEKRAEELAKKTPGQCYIVCEVVSSFVVDGLTKETATP